MSPWAKLKLKRAAWWNKKDDIEKGDFLVKAFFFSAIAALAIGAFLMLSGFLLIGGIFSAVAAFSLVVVVFAS